MVLSLRWLLLGWLLVCEGAGAAVPALPRFQVLTAADGLPSNTVPALARDRAGHLWLGTFDGLARYDGVGFRVWRHDPDDAASLPGNIVQAVHVDAQDRIWVATESGGLSVMDAKRTGFRHFRKATHPQMLSDDVFTITSQGGVVWFGSFGGGLNKLDARGTITHYSASATLPEGLPSNDVLALAFDARGSLWIGTLDGLAVYDGRSFRRVSLPVSAPVSNTIYALIADAGTLWVTTAEGVFLRDAQGQWQTPPWSPMFARPNAVMSMVYNDDGHYWLGGQGGLWRTRGDAAPVPVQLDAQGAGPTRVLQALLRQPDGGMWVPVPSRGLGYLQSDWRRIAMLTGAEGLSPGLHRGIASASAGGVWLTSSKGVIERIDTASGDISVLAVPGDVLGNLRLGSILEDRRNQLWVGGGNGSLTRIDLVSQAVHTWSADQAEDATPATGPIDWLLESAEGDIWLSSLGGGLQRRDGVSGKVLDDIGLDSGHGLEAADTEALAIGPDHSLWIAGAHGVSRWDAAARKFVPVTGIGRERIFSFAFQDSRRLWVQRLSGLELWRLDQGRWTRERRYSVAEGIPATESTGLKIDAAQQLWLATRRGLFRVDAGTGQVRHFGIRTGLLSQEFNDSALHLTADGVLVGSTSDGSVMLLDTGFADPAPTVPNLVLDSVQVGRQHQTLPLPVEGGFELEPGDHELQISARLLSFEDPMANRYRSRLQGFEDDWVEQGASGERVFSTLQPGDYVFQVQAVDAWGNSSAQRSLQFRVLPPWWRSAWGMVLLGLAAALLLAVLGMLYRRRLRRRNAWQLAEHKRELAEQASQAKTRFLATLGHEVRTPMTGVLGMAELLQKTSLSQQQRGYTQAIQSAGSHLLRLVNDALDIARIEAGKLELQQKPFNVRALIDEAVALSAPVARQRGLGFAVTVEESVPAALYGDPVRICQILHNLLGNAIKFTGQGGVSLHVSALPTGGVRVEVGDTGPGMSQEQQSRLFQRFEQADGARTSERYGGSGLGLAICRELALAMGGQIEVESAPGQGARFSVELPLPAAIDPGRGGSDAVAVSGRSLRVLLVEDDSTVAEVIVGLLRDRGHEVVHAPHSLAAMTAVVGAHFDIGLLDLDLPGLDGLALARQLHLQGFAAPLLAVTARADAAVEEQTRAAGFSAFLRKPMTGDILAEAMARALQNFAATEAAGAGGPRQGP